MVEFEKFGRHVPLTVEVETYDVVGPSAAGPFSPLRARVSLLPAGQHVEYILRVTHKGSQNWTVFRRFSEVYELHEQLQKRLQALPQPPTKTAVRHFDIEHLEGRRADLSAYFSALCERRDVLNCFEAQEFFGLPSHVPEFLTPFDLEAFEDCEVREPGYGITNIDYDSARGFLLLGSTDQTMRLDAKLTGAASISQLSLWRQTPGSFTFSLVFIHSFTAPITSVLLMRSDARSVLCHGDTQLCFCGLANGAIGLRGLAMADLDAQMQDTRKQKASRGDMFAAAKHQTAVAALAADNIDLRLFSTSQSKMLIHDMVNCKLQSEVVTEAPVTQMHFCKVREHLYVGMSNGVCAVWSTSLTHPRQLCTVPDEKTSAPSMAFSSARISAMLFHSAVRALLISASPDGLTMWEMRNKSGAHYGRPIGQFLDMSTPPSSLAWAASSRELIAGFPNGSIVIFDADKGEATFGMKAHTEDVVDMRWLEQAGQRVLMTASKDRSVKFWRFPCKEKVVDKQRERAESVMHAEVVHIEAPAGISGDAVTLAENMDRHSVGAPPVEVNMSMRRTSSGVPAVGKRPSGERLGSFVGKSLSGAGPRQSGGFAPEVRSSVAGAPDGRPVEDGSDDDLCGWDG